ncbi:fgf-2 [Matsumuraeses phaseoli granulovirus]|uniref:Fgf-2 n=1 Tax=Matsumuraeses phaseoli granulovirus TaxID=2760664 RepID=A0AAE7SXS7_9BBAC|nr:fgf-2 [Matsumuraeses phaseoli granulovirus]QOD40074.1 fgf-2 [Matsumuraeses phaseoli granulovirus]
MCGRPTTCVIITEMIYRRILFVVAFLKCVLTIDNTFEYDVEQKVQIHLLNDDIVPSPMFYLQMTNKTFGLGYTVGVDHNLNLYTERYSNYIRSTPSNYTYYFFKDRNKYYIRDERCNFVCVNPCGTVFTSAIRYQHYCKFVIDKFDNKYSIFASSTGQATTHRILNFNKTLNMLTANVVYNTNDTVHNKAPFTLKHGPRPQMNKCVSLLKVPQKNLDMKDQERCQLDIDVSAAAIINPNIDMYVKQDNKKFYKLKMGNSYINGDGALTGENVIFQKNYVEPNVYIFRNVDTCKYLCQSSECGVYMAEENSKECNIKVEQSLLRDSFYIKFMYNNYYLSYNNTDDSMTFSHNTKSRIEFVETVYDNKVSCNPVEINNEPSTKKCGDNNSSANTLTINLPHLFLFLVLNYNKTLTVD